MASTYSSTLRIELIGDGDQSGIWGQTTNNNLGSLLEQAITGVVTITMVDTNYTLTNYNGVVDEARNAVIVASGTNSAQRDIIAPLVEKIYTIKNSTVGGYAIRIIGATGTGVTIPNGVTTSVYCDGTNFYNLQVGTTGNETINGNLTVTGTTTLQGALSGTTASFSGAISSVSPAFTGTPTVPTAANGTSTTQAASTAFVANTVTALGLGTMSTQNANNVAITGGAINGTTVGATTRATGAFTTLTLTNPLDVIYGGTGVTTSTGSGSNVLSASPAFTGTPTAPTASPGTNTTQLATTAFVQNIAGSLGTMSTQNANNVAITGGTISGLASPLPVLSGGTGVTTSTGSGNNVLSTSPTLVTPILGTPTSGTLTNCSGLPLTTGITGTLAVTNGGTGSTTASGARTNLGLAIGTDIPSLTGVGASGSWGISVTGSAATAGYITNSSYNGYGARTVSSSAPTGGSNGDIWYQV